MREFWLVCGHGGKWLGRCNRVGLLGNAKAFASKADSRAAVYNATASLAAAKMCQYQPAADLGPAGKRGGGNRHASVYLLKRGDSYLSGAGHWLGLAEAAVFATVEHAERAADSLPVGKGAAERWVQVASVRGPQQAMKGLHRDLGVVLSVISRPKWWQGS